MGHTFATLAILSTTLTLLGPMLAPGCASVAETSTRSSSLAGPADAPILLDGVIEEWPLDTAGLADASYLYFRMSVRDEQFAPQASDRSIAMHLDADADPATGLRVDAPDGVLGADLRITWSKPVSQGGKGRGVEVEALDASGKSTPIDRAATDLSLMPTYASNWYEGRIGRTFSAPGLPTKGLLSSGRARGVFTLTPPESGRVRWSDSFSVELPPAQQPIPSDESIPRADGLRVVSYNVLWSMPEKNPEPFARVLRALKPDIVLLAEWDKSTSERIREWFVQHVDSRVDWACVSDPRGVAIVSRHPINPLGLGNLMLPAGEDDRRSSVRAIGGEVFTPAGTVAAVALHLKCCGSAGGPEDRTRMAEARLVNSSLRRALAEMRAPAMVVVGGDINLVGSRPPLDLLRAGLERDGGDLRVADAWVLGDRAMYTWTDDSSEFAPGRLDYILYSGSAARATSAFVLDDARLSDSSLRSIGIQRGDTGLSDHRPVVVDLKLK